MTFSRFFLCLVAAVGIAGCGRQQEKTVQAAGPAARNDVLRKPPEITSESEDRFRDLVFYVEAENSELTGTARRLHASGIYEGESVGFDFDWGMNGKWEKFPVKGLPEPFYRDIGCFRSTGAKSDRLLWAMAELYGARKPTKRGKEIVATLFVIQGDPLVPERGLVRAKLFFNENSEKHYSELFMVLDLPRDRLVLAEKDPEYRVGVLQSLGGAKDKS